MINLKRFVKNEEVTLGRLEYAGQEFFTVERPWLNNRPNISCIPDGTYKMVRVDSPRFGEDMWEIADVPDRTHILIHVANNPSNVQGCIGFGRSVFPTLKGVGNSRVAIEQFYHLSAGSHEEEITITTEVLT